MQQPLLDRTALRFTQNDEALKGLTGTRGNRRKLGDNNVRDRMFSICHRFAVKKPVEHGLSENAA
jgi:hypothetical protein